MRKLRPDAGLTLLELLIVMGVLALLFGMGAGTLASLNPGERAAVGLVQDVLRSAHNSAISRMAPARVRIDPEGGTLVAEGLEVVGTWHFEDADLTGAEGLQGVYYGMEAGVSPDGYLGAALDLRDAPRGGEVQFDIQSDPAFGLRDGFAIDLALKLGEGAGGGRLLEVTDCVEVELESGGGLEMRIYRRTTESSTGRERRGVGLSLATELGVLREGRWSQVRFSYDRRAARILVDGVEVARQPGDFEVWKLEHPLRLGGGATPVLCVIDELVVSVVAASQEHVVPGDVRLAKDAPRLVQFVAGGSLDPTVHLGPVELGLEFPDGRRDRVRVGMYGTVE